MSAHTPGPWIAKEWDDTAGYDCIYGGICILTTCGDLVVVLDGSYYNEEGGEQPASDRERMEADSRLIAAAPELLAELIALVDFVSQRDDTAQSFLEDARAAIAKATGAAP